MRGWIRKAIGATLVAGSIGLGAVFVADENSTPPSTPPSTTEFNAFVQSGGGTCVAATTPVAFADIGTNAVDEVCGTVDQANDAVASGNSVCIRPGTYTGQLINGNKTSDTLFYGCDGGVTFTGPPASPTTACPGPPDGPGEYQTGIICVTTNFFHLKNVSIDCQTTVQDATCIGQANGTDITFEDVNFYGDRPSFQAQADRFHWDGGEVGVDDATPSQRWCGDGYPATINGDNTTIENVKIWQTGSDQTPWSPGGPCGGGESSNGFHLENIRVEAPGFTLRNVWFAPGSEVGSGHVFFSGAGAASNVTMIGNYFGLNSDGTTSLQANSNVGSMANWTIRHNFFALGDALQGTASGTWIVDSNTGTVINCGVCVRTLNVPYSGSTGTDYAAVTNYAGLGVDSGGRIQSGSTLIGKGPTTCSSTAFDIDNTVRPVGSRCEPGPFEWTGAGG